MAPLLPGIDIHQLSVDQRLELIALIWDSIPDSAESPSVPQWHREELERRMADADASPEKSIPWEQVRDRSLC
jgi:putative addiction module component (TIGR02574 family)